jgi:antitoxin component of RelBE/YafQ-DinJ toxin-antitoxin module
MKKEAILRTRVQQDFANRVAHEAAKIGLNASEFLRLALIEKITKSEGRK